jgi:hypothetical protein
MTVDDEEDGIMGKIVVPADSDPIDDGDLLCILLHRSQGGNGNKVKPNAGDENDNDDTDDKPVQEKLKRRTLVVVEIINVWYLTYIYFLGGNLRMHHIHSQFNNSVHS